MHVLAELNLLILAIPGYLRRLLIWGEIHCFPRFYETFGEDPLVSARMGAAYVSALQNNEEIAPYRQAACAKHFVGYSDPRSGWDRSPTDISFQSLQELFIPPFQASG